MEAVSYLHPNWAEIIFNAPSNASMVYEGGISESIVGVPSVGIYFPYVEVILTKDSSMISGLSNSISVGTVSETSTDNYTSTVGIDDVIAYWGNDKTRIVIYSPSTIYAPANCYALFGDNVTGDGCYFNSLTTLTLQNFNTSKTTNMWSMFNGIDITSLDLGNFNLVSCTDFTDMLYGCSSLQRITLPYNLQSGYTIDLPDIICSGGTIKCYFYNGSAGPYVTIGTATSGRTVSCSTETNKITLEGHAYRPSGGTEK